MSADKVAILIVNYNMPERTDALVEHILKYVKWPNEIIVIDNGSDIKKSSQYTSLGLRKNVQTTNGWLMGLHYADALTIATEYGDYFAYWFLITSAEFVGENDPLTPMVEALQVDENLVGVHPILTQDSTTSWNHMKQSGNTFMIDNIASLYRASWFDSIGRFDPALIYAWGIDLETCWKARRDGCDLFIHPDAQVKKVTNIGYTMERMNMSSSEREALAGANTSKILSERYGPNYWSRLLHEFE